MSRNCGNERMAMIMQYVAIGSMIIMANLNHMIPAIDKLLDMQR